MATNRLSGYFGPQISSSSPQISSLPHSLHPSFSWDSVRKSEEMERPAEEGETPEEVAPLRFVKKRGIGSIREQVRREAALRTVSEIRFGPPRTQSPGEMMSAMPGTPPPPPPPRDEEADELALARATQRVSKILERNPSIFSVLADLKREDSATSISGSLTDTKRSSQSRSLRDSVLTLSTAATSLAGDIDPFNEHRHSCRSKTTDQEVESVSPRSSLVALSPSSSVLQEDEAEDSEMLALERFKLELQNKAKFSTRYSPRGPSFYDEGIRGPPLSRPQFLRNYASAENIDILSTEVKPLFVGGRGQGRAGRLSVEAVGGMGLRSKSDPLAPKTNTLGEKKVNFDAHDPLPKAEYSMRESMEDGRLSPLRVKPAITDINTQRYTMRKSTPKQHLSLFPPSTPPPRPAPRVLDPLATPQPADHHRSVFVPETPSGSFFDLDDDKEETMLEVVKQKFRKVKSITNFRDGDEKDRDKSTTAFAGKKNENRTAIPEGEPSCLGVSQAIALHMARPQPPQAQTGPAWQLPTLMLPVMDMEAAVMQAADSVDDNPQAPATDVDITIDEGVQDDHPLEDAHPQTKGGSGKREKIGAWFHSTFGGKKEHIPRPNTAKSIERQHHQETGSRGRARFSFADVKRPRVEGENKGKGRAADQAVVNSGPHNLDGTPRASGTYDIPGRKSITLSIQERMGFYDSSSAASKDEAPTIKPKRSFLSGLRSRQSMPLLRTTDAPPQDLRHKTSTPLFSTVKNKFGRTTIHKKQGERIAEALRNRSSFDDGNFADETQELPMEAIEEHGDEAEIGIAKKPESPKKSEPATGGAELVRVQSGEWVGSSRKQSVRKGTALSRSP